MSKNGTHGNQWQRLQVQVDVSGGKQLVIEGVRGSSYLGDIAIDDIHVTTSQAYCPSLRKSFTFIFYIIHLLTLPVKV